MRIGKTIFQELSALEVGQEIDKKKLIKRIYGTNDLYQTRSFDVHLCLAKKKFPRNQFDSHYKSIIKRVI